MKIENKVAADAAILFFNTRAFPDRKEGFIIRPRFEFAEEVARIGERIFSI